MWTLRSSERGLIPRTLFFSLAFVAGCTGMVLANANPVHHFTVTLAGSPGPFTAGATRNLIISAVDSGSVLVDTMDGNINVSIALFDGSTPVTGIGTLAATIAQGDNGTIIVPEELRRASSGPTLSITVTRLSGTAGGTQTMAAGATGTGTSGSFGVDAGTPTKLLILSSGLTQNSGEDTTDDGVTGTATNVVARQPFAVTVRLVDDFWNSVTSGARATDVVQLSGNVPADFTFGSNNVAMTAGEVVITGIQIATAEVTRILTADDTTSGLIADGTRSITTSGPAIAEVFPYPNPITPGSQNMRFQFRLDTAKPVTLKIVDAFGQEIYRRSVSGQASTNDPSEFIWDGKNDNGITVAAGIYYALLEVDGSITSKKKIGVKK